MNKELTKVYNTISAWKDGCADNPTLFDAFDSVLSVIEDADEHYSCLNCKHFDDACEFEYMPFENPCARSMKDLWQPINDAGELAKMSNNVVKPKHYQIMQGVEVIDVIRAILSRSDYNAQQGYYAGNVIKYILRADKKNGVEDLEKAEVYLNWLIESM